MESKTKLQNPVKAIRAKCLDCSGNNYTEVELCPASNCALFPFRFGKNPYRTKRLLSDAQKEVFKERLKTAREKRVSNNENSNQS